MYNVTDNIFDKKSMQNCEYCGRAIEGKKITAKYCSNICRIKAYRRRKGIEEPFGSGYAKIRNVTGSYTCCANARLYSPFNAWGKILRCDICNQSWVIADPDLVAYILKREKV